MSFATVPYNEKPLSLVVWLTRGAIISGFPQDAVYTHNGQRWLKAFTVFERYIQPNRRYYRYRGYIGFVEDMMNAVDSHGCERFEVYFQPQTGQTVAWVTALSRYERMRRNGYCEECAAASLSQ